MKLVIMLMILFSNSLFAYDSGLLAKNCYRADINKDQLFTVVKVLNHLNLKYSLEINSTNYTDYTVVAMARNGMLQVDTWMGVDVGFRMNRKLRKLLRDKRLVNADVDFKLTSVGFCKDFTTK